MEHNFLDEKIKDSVKDVLIEYKKFAFKQDIKKVCLAVLLGTAFDKLIKVLSATLISPFFIYILNKTNGSWRDLKIELIPDQLVLQIGVATGAVFDFLVISFILFILLKKIIKEEEKTLL